MEQDTIPDSSNFFGCLSTPLSKEEIVGKFAARGWTSRRIAWHDYEVRCEWAELVLDGEGEILFHGPVCPATEYIERVLEILKAEAIGYQVELHDDGGALHKEYSWRPEN
jgi:hypothetical protein